MKHGFWYTSPGEWRLVWIVIAVAVVLFLRSILRRD